MIADMTLITHSIVGVAVVGVLMVEITAVVEVVVDFVGWWMVLVVVLVVVMMMVSIVTDFNSSSGAATLDVAVGVE